MTIMQDTLDERTELQLGSPPESAKESFLRVTDLHAYYGESYIVQGLSFAINKGDIVALLGRNGAGKTSTLRAIARAEEPVLKQGGIIFDAQSLHDNVAFEAARAGVALVPEDRCIFPGLTVEENIQLAQISGPLGWSIEKIYQHFPRLRERKSQDGSSLSGGEQQMLALARALAKDLKLLLLDEPYEGLAPVIVQEIEKILGYIKEQGITTIIVEQNAIAALKLANRAIILDMGEIKFDGDAEEVLNNKALRDKYLAI